VLVGLYDQDEAQLLPVSDATTEVFDRSIRLTAVGLAARPASPKTADPGTIIWNDTLSLNFGACFLQPRGATLALDWSILQRPTQKLTLFAHLFGEGMLVGQHDALPVARFPTDAWLPGEAIPVLWELPVNLEGMSSAPLTVHVGLYDYIGQRWPVTEAGNPIPNGELTIPCSSANYF
jgi:hypothetical protein